MANNKKTLTIFISMPYTGLTTNEIRENYIASLNIIKDQMRVDQTCNNVCEVHSMFDVDIKDNNGIAFADDIHLMTACDIVLFAPGWKNSDGCRIEHDICEYCNIKYFEHCEAFDNIYYIDDKIIICDHCDTIFRDKEECHPFKKIYASAKPVFECIDPTGTFDWND